MTQPKLNTSEPSQHAVKEHVKAILRKIPLRSQKKG
jgi:hypothetical protein